MFQVPWYHIQSCEYFVLHQPMTLTMVVLAGTLNPLFPTGRVLSGSSSDRQAILASRIKIRACTQIQPAAHGVSQQGSLGISTFYITRETPPCPPFSSTSHLNFNLLILLKNEGVLSFSSMVHLTPHNILRSCEVMLLSRRQPRNRRYTL